MALSKIYTVVIEGETLGFVQLLLSGALPPWVGLTVEGKLYRFFSFESAEAFVIANGAI